MEEWIKRKTNDITELPVYLETIISEGIHGFGLRNKALLGFIQRVLRTFFTRGVEIQFKKFKTDRSTGRTACFNAFGTHVPCKEVPEEMVEEIVARCVVCLNSGDRALPQFAKFIGLSK